MLRKSVLVVFCTLLLGPAWSALAGFDPTLAVYWPLDEGTGTIAHDMTVNANNGTISAGPTWVTPGKIGVGALKFTGTGDVRGTHVAMDQPQLHHRHVGQSHVGGERLSDPLFRPCRPTRRT